ncbi:MAG: orotidine-5'-phosphate decarboxylase [Variovorax sp.]|nr:orotidine-5'-phosphate decarboxylase [Variovorax sp.]
MPMPMPNPVVVSLDFETATEAIALVERLGPEADHYKIGLQMLTEAGPDLPRHLVNLGKSVFLDLKLHEIPSSVAGAVRASGKLGATLVTVHACAGSAVLRAAVDAAAPFPDLKVLALTVITSLGDHDLPEIGLAPSVDAQVKRLALLASGAGCHGVVASAREAKSLRQVLPEGTLIVCPGIQLHGAGGKDQLRIAGPAEAAAAGATHVVIGRAITATEDPLSAFRSAVSAFLDGARSVA